MAVASAGGDTIFALSTAGLPSAIAIIRTSGPQSGKALEALARKLPTPRTASLAILEDPENSEPIDRAITLWLPGPDTVTGEDMAEYQVHGSRAVAAKMLEVLGAMPEMRSADAGEFTRRAFLNGRMDLSEAEGLGDLLAAETETQRRHALAMAEGGLAAEIARWREQLLTAEARLEAVLNFSDEGDVDEAEEQAASDVAQIVHSEIMVLLASPPAERLRDGIRVTLAGPPNAGKSTLFNALVAREAAIVSPQAGTTRDIIEAPVEIDGVAFLFSDTAGLRAGQDAIEDEGVRRARAVTARADIVLWLGEADNAPAGENAILLHARSDEEGRSAAPEGWLAVSALTGEGIANLRRELLRRASRFLPAEGQIALNARQREALRDAASKLVDIDNDDWVLLSESLRLARGDLDRISGQGGIEDMLDTLFGQFCIGK